jgi:hypothetical protein
MYTKMALIFHFITGFQVRGEGGALKKIAPSGWRREFFWGISCEKSRFYAKKSYFFQLRREARKFWGFSCEKSRFYAKKSYFFPILGGGEGARPLDPPLYKVMSITKYILSNDDSSCDMTMCVFHYVNKHLKSNDQTVFKEALATILTKKIICFGNW